MSRSRRTTTKAVNYAKEQEFSDGENIFEDESDREDAAPVMPVARQKATPGGGGGGSRGRGRPKKSDSLEQFAAPYSALESTAPPPTTTTATAPPNMDYTQTVAPIYVEKGYDNMQLPLRERFTFLPEYEPDGAPKIECLVGRRVVQDDDKTTTAVAMNDNAKENAGNAVTDGNNAANDKNPSSSGDNEDDNEDESNSRGRRKRSTRGSMSLDKDKNSQTSSSSEDKITDTTTTAATATATANQHCEYEYLVKYKGRSYLHLEWKTGADLESMNKSAKTLYRRFVKKISAGNEDDLEDPDFDPSYAQPQKIVDEAEQEIVVELSDKELVNWTKEREMELAKEEAQDSDDDSDDDNETQHPAKNKLTHPPTTATTTTTTAATTVVTGVAATNGNADPQQESKAEPEEEEEVDLDNVSIDTLRKLANKDGSYYPVIANCDNPYRDGHITTPPKKPRVSYIFFQYCLRSKYMSKHPRATQSEIMTMLGSAWRTMTEDQTAPFLQLAKEEAEQHERERQMLEKAQKPSEMWQPMRRCLMVLDRLTNDGFCNIFLEPVDLEQFPDYEDIVDIPMDLGTVRTKLNHPKYQHRYQAPENFARDMRKVWNNCKVYNQHGSAIWHVADYMSKHFERLYHAWVLEFRERYLRWVNPKARPWEHTCRACDGTCGTPDDKMVLCDHCDAMYGMECLDPVLPELPSGIWHCPDCKPKFNPQDGHYASLRNSGVRMLSAVSEQAARKRAELGDTPKKTLHQKMYLVKWAGLGYEYCTWETKEDVDDDHLIGEYIRLNNTTPDEPDANEDDVNAVLDKTDHVGANLLPQTTNSNGKILPTHVSQVHDLRSQLYAQTRAFQFTRFAMDVPNLLSGECGPKTKATVLCAEVTTKSSTNDSSATSTSTSVVTPEKPDVCPSSNTSNSKKDGADAAVKNEEDNNKEDNNEEISDTKKNGHAEKKMPIESLSSSTQLERQGKEHSKDIVECLTEMTFRLARKPPRELIKLNAKLPPLLTGEYDAVVPITSKGLMMNVGEIHGSVAFLGYRAFPDNTKGPAEKEKLIRNVGDKIIAVGGVSTIHKTFKQVILLLRESGKHKFAYMRFLENKYAVCRSDLTSVGDAGKYTVEELQNKFTSERRRLLVQRRQQLVDADELLEMDKNQEDDESDQSVGSNNSSDEDDSSDEGSEGEFEPDSDDEELARKAAALVVATTTSVQVAAVGATELNPNTANKVTLHGIATNEEKPKTLTSISRAKEEGTPLLIRQETTRSLAYRLLDVDIGYSSDEAGDEDCAYFLDGVDETFTTAKQAKKIFIQGRENEETNAGDKPKETGDDKGDKKEDSADVIATVPIKRNGFSALGKGGQTSVAVTLSSREPNPEDFDNFPYPSTKAIQEKEKIAEAEEAKKAAEVEAEIALEAEKEPDALEQYVKRSTVKVEQMASQSDEVIRVWASAEDAAATLQISLDDIKQMLKAGKYDEDLGDEVGKYRWRYAAVNADVTAVAGDTTRGSKKGKEAFLEFREKLYDHNDPHIYKNGNKLRDYQIDGVNWLASTWYKRHSCILADEMGLGKTVQIVSYIEHLYRVEKTQRPYLVVVPLSTVEHWRREFQGWTDLVCCVYHDRQRIWRDIMREYEWYYADRPHTPEYLKFDVLVTTYDTLIGDFDIIGQIPWRVAVVDEAHRLRNQKGKLLECMKEISARGTLQYGYQSRILMTGTPLQNNIQELWTLLNFIEPYKFPSLEEFQTNFGNMANREQVESLQRQIMPYMLRRVKEDVAKDIPAKEETLIDVELTSIQKQYYRAIFEHNHSFLSMGTSRNTAPKLMNIQMELRKCCNHPFLLDGVEQKETEKHFTESIENGAFEGKGAEEQQLMLNEHGYIQTSGKMVLLDKLLPKLRQEDHKVLIFSQMVKMLDLMSEYCDFRNFNYERLDGRIRGTERQKAIDRFETQADSFVFLLSTRAGGVGINLTAADICIIFDSDWNPQNDVQAQARCHRIGQTKDVMIYRLVTSRTFEQEMFDRASKKLGLEQAVLGSFETGNEDDKPTTKEMEQLLKKGAYALLEDENDEMAGEFCSDDIESILEKRTRTRVVEGAKTANWLNKAGMNVSKSRFTGDSAAATADVDVDDPLFWQKVMPDFVTPDIMLNKLNELSELVEGSGPKRGGKKKQSKKGTSDVPAYDKKATEDNAHSQTNGDTEQKEVYSKAEETEKDENKNPKESAELENAEAEEESVEKDHNSEEKEELKAAQISRTSQRKVVNFMSDLKSMMDGVLEEAEDDSLPQSEKATCQKLLLTISMKEILFNEEQRHVARVLLKRLEGDRRRRCRTTGEKSSRKSGIVRRDEFASNAAPEELLILSKHQQRKRKQKGRPSEGQSARKRKKRTSDDDDDDEDDDKPPGNDGYLLHSDSEGDWSDVGENIYKSTKKRSGISMKEAKRRRTWASDKDTATAAGRPWPSFPRSVVSKVLATVLDELIKYDAAKGGIFSVPVPRDDFPEYYEQIKMPMDYGTMKRKLERGEYRSAQAMQKDCIVIMTNCLQFNAADSDIVKEAREQSLMRPAVLKNAATKHNLFLAEDGSVLDVYNDEKGENKDDVDGKDKKKGRKRGKPIEKEEKIEKRKLKKLVRCKKCEGCKKKDCGECDPCLDKTKFGGPGNLKQGCSLRRCADWKKQKTKRAKEHNDSIGESADEHFTVDKDVEDGRMKKPRIRISLSGGRGTGDQEDGAVPVKGKKRKGKMKRSKIADSVEDSETPLQKKRNAAVENGNDEQSVKRKKKKKTADSGDAVDNSLLDNDKELKNQVVQDDQPNTKEEAHIEDGSEKRDDADAAKKEPDPSDIWLDVALLKSKRQALDGSFPEASLNLKKHGPFQLPSLVEDDRFKDVAMNTLNKMCRHDQYAVFTDKVTEEEAPDYYDVVKNPMDFGTMREKIENGRYGSGSSAASEIFDDFVLVFDNCALYNDEGDEVVDEAARILGLLPEVYATACSAIVGKRKTPKKRRNT